MVWLFERTRVSFTAGSSHFVQKCSTGAVANGARKILVFDDSAKALVPVVKQQRQGVPFYYHVLPIGLRLFQI